MQVHKQHVWSRVHAESRAVSLAGTTDKREKVRRDEKISEHFKRRKVVQENPSQQGRRQAEPQQNLKSVLRGGALACLYMHTRCMPSKAEFGAHSHHRPVKSKANIARNERCRELEGFLEQGGESCNEWC
jgi:hypothetical protein